MINRIEGFQNKSRARRLIAALSVTALAAAGLVTSNAPSATAAGLAPVMGIASGSGILWESNADFNRDMDAIAATGAEWIRVDFDWSSIQYESPTTWRWDRSTDRIVAGAEARGLKVLGQLGYSPPWARPSDCPAGSNKCIPTDVTAYGNFVRAAAGAMEHAPQARRFAGVSRPGRYGTNPTIDPLLSPSQALIVIARC